MSEDGALSPMRNLRLLHVLIAQHGTRGDLWFAAPMCEEGEPGGSPLPSA